jgi:CheY-like chemotaxis protein
MDESGQSVARYRKIMVIDDTHLDRFVAERLLTKNAVAYEVICLESGQHGLDYLNGCVSNNDELPDLILLDIRMPEMDGFEFLEEFDKMPEAITSVCRIMMLSTSLDPDDLERVQQNRHVKKFINKPLNKEKLSAI